MKIKVWSSGHTCIPYMNIKPFRRADKAYHGQNQFGQHDAALQYTTQRHNSNKEAQCSMFIIYSELLGQTHTSQTHTTCGMGLACETSELPQ